MINPEAMKPQGQAILDYFKGDKNAMIIMHGDDGEDMDVPVSVYFRQYEEWPELERKAVDQCYGRVLDLGAGTGCHTLVLQERGIEVCAIDFSPECVEVMQAQGIRDARYTDVFEFEVEPFDTILMMMNGIGFVETLEGLEQFLKSIGKLLKPGGQILFDSHDARRDMNPNDPASYLELYEGGFYYGEVELWLEYREQHGSVFGWLYVDTETLKDYCRKTGWSCRIIHQEEDGAYLAQLTRS